MDNRFVQVKHMVRSERENMAYYEGGRIIINLDHIISLQAHQTLMGYWTIQMTNSIIYVVDHSILNHFPIIGDDYLDQNIF